jgi:hypothetical protein
MVNVSHCFAFIDAEPRIEASWVPMPECVLDTQMRSDPCGKVRKSPEDVAVAGDEFTFTGRDVRQGTEAVFNSRMKSSESNGAGRRESRMGHRFRGSEDTKRV